MSYPVFKNHCRMLSLLVSHKNLIYGTFPVSRNVNWTQSNVCTTALFNFLNTPLPQQQQQHKGAAEAVLWKHVLDLSIHLRWRPLWIWYWKYISEINKLFILYCLSKCLMYFGLKLVCVTPASEETMCIQWNPHLMFLNLRFSPS
jgi:hypothetical protein